MMYKTLTGKEFNTIYAGKEFYKLTNESENHNGFQFKTGLNIDTVEFNPKGRCQQGGIYFTELIYVLKWLKYNGKRMKKIRKVLIPNCAMVYVEKYKFKANKMILGESMNLDNFLSSGKITMEMFLIAVKENDYVFECIPEEIKNKRICLAAIKRNGVALKYVPDRLKTEDICSTAINQNGLALEYVPENIKRIENFSWAAIKKNGLALKHVPTEFKTIKFCKLAIDQNGSALQYVPDKLKKKNLCLEAIKQNSEAMNYIPNELKTEYFCLDAINQNRKALLYIPNELKTEKLY